MFDFLSFLKPVTAFLIDNLGLIGMMLATLMPFILLALAVGALMAVVYLIRTRDTRKLKNKLKKANALRKTGKSEDAFWLYEEVYKTQGKENLITAYKIGMLCKEGVADDWRLKANNTKPEYWFSMSLNPFKPETYYEYGLSLIEDAGDSLLRAAKGASYIHQAARLGHQEAEELANRLDQQAAAAMARGRMAEAAGLGHAQAQYGMYQQSSGEEAVEWLKYAAGQKHVEACEVYGIMHLRGEGVKENMDKAVQYLTIPAEQGSMKAQMCLGLIYSDPKYRKHSDDEAIKWYKLAAEQGHPYAMYNLAARYTEKMDQYAKEHGLKTKYDRISNHTYLSYWEHFQYWQAKAAEHGLTPESVQQSGIKTRD